MVECVAEGDCFSGQQAVRKGISGTETARPARAE
jgi:hypothetical protein